MRGAREFCHVLYFFKYPEPFVLSCVNNHFANHTSIDWFHPCVGRGFHSLSFLPFLLLRSLSFYFRQLRFTQFQKKGFANTAVSTITNLAASIPVSPPPSPSPPTSPPAAVSPPPSPSPPDAATPSPSLTLPDAVSPPPSPNAVSPPPSS